MQVFINKYRLEKPAQLSQEQYRSYLSLLCQQLWRLEAEGWSPRVIKSVYVKNLSRELSTQKPIKPQLSQAFLLLHQFGSSSFQSMWRLEMLERRTPYANRRLLRLALTYVSMPSQLSGTKEETAVLLSHFSQCLSPDAGFWSDLSKTVRRAYPGKSLSEVDEDASLKRQVHQFRYLISSYQAQWVRQKYRQANMTDAQALAVYLNRKKSESSLLTKLGLFKPIFSLSASSRLHNKRALGKDGSIRYPDNANLVNIKVLVRYHTEFIISQEGFFLNLLDLEGVSQNGLLNGASFNYAGANFRDHEEMDIKPVKPFDPAFRMSAVRKEGEQFINPSRKAYKDKTDRLFAQDKTSLFQRVKASRRGFKLLLKKLRKQRVKQK